MRKILMILGVIFILLLLFSVTCKVRISSGNELQSEINSENLEERFFNDNTALIIAAWRGNINAVNALLKAGANIHAKNMYGMNALMYAAEGGYTEVAAILLKAGADINDVNNEGSTALMIAAIHGHEEVIKVLLNAGADTEIKNNNGKTAADYARENEVLKDSDVIEELETLG